MSLRMDGRRDRYMGHDYPGTLGHGFAQYERDEIELGARVASTIDDPDQWWWTLNEERITEDLGIE